MGATKPWPTRWPEPFPLPAPKEDDRDREPLGEPDYEIEVDPDEIPFRLPEDLLVPYLATWGVTQACNLRCDHCYDATAERRTDLPTEQALAVVDRLAEMGISFLVFSGGEPLLRQDLFQILAQCRHKGLGIALRSNCTLITPGKARRLAELGTAVVGVSLDGVTERAHDLVRGPGTFQRVRHGIQALLAEGIRVTVEVVLRKGTIPQALQFISLVEEWGVDEVNFAAMSPQGRAARLLDEVLDYPAWKHVTAQLYQASKHARVAVSPSCTLVGDCQACIEPNITCDGWVTPCYLSRRKLFDVLRTEPAQARASLRQQRLFSLDACGRMRDTDVARILAVPGHTFFGTRFTAFESVAGLAGPQPAQQEALVRTLS